MTSLPPTVVVTDVALRDGLQIQQATLATETKLAIADALLDAGVRSLEATSFVRPDLVPQLADAAELWPRLPSSPDARFTALVPNRRGLERALSVGCRDLVFVLSASEGHARANTHRSVAEGLQEASAIMERIASEPGARLSAAIATSFVCPFDGPTPPSRVGMVTAELVRLGIGQIRLADTLGKADPAHVRRLVDTMRSRFPDVRFALHLHDTYGTGMANVYAGLLAGVTEFDGALGGIGGCPFAPGAAGNIATEDLVFMCESMGIATGIDLEALATAGEILRRALARPLASSVSAALGW